MVEVEDAPGVERVPTSLGAVAVHRRGSGPPAVLWHSMFTDSTMWSRVVPALQRDRELLVVDGPGWGASDRLRGSHRMAEAVRAAAEIVEHLAPGRPVDWVGCAWGGHVGMELAATWPQLVRTLVAISAPVEPVDPVLRRRIRLLLPVLRTVGPIAPVSRAIVQGLLTDEHARDPGLVGVVLDALLQSGFRSSAASVRSFILNRVDISDLLPRIEAPTLFVAGDDRGDWSPERMRAAAARVPGARAEVVAGARTLVPLEQPRATVDLIRAFWAAGAAA